ncbi:MAG: NADH-quinone oxidoreductase subunit NuoE [Bacillota bacterium]
MNPQLLSKLDEIIAKYAGVRGALMPVLHEAQNCVGYLPLEVQQYIARALKVPFSQVYGVVTFYSHFTTTPKGKHTIGLCMGTACYVRGAEGILEAVSEELDITVGQTSEDRLFTLTQTRCLGTCGLAPVMMIDDQVYGNLTPERTREILQRYQSAAAVEVQTHD